ncbi:response regulator [Desulfococcaceae bacterium HSG7]|nr:response regulator [Desulfococcaceae bacterium HSG7]
MFKNNRILIVDDDQGIRNSYKQSLLPLQKSETLQKGMALFGDKTADADSGETIVYNLTFAENGEAGVEYATQAKEQGNAYAVAFVDMQMPGIDGAETCKRLWKIDPDIKIVIVTAFSKYTPDQIIAIAGRDDLFYVRKPFNTHEIRQFARVLTHQWNLEREKQQLIHDLEMANQKLEKKVQEQSLMLNECD